MVAELEESDEVLVSVEDLWLIAGILAFQQVKERVNARLANQGSVVEVETRVLDEYCRRLLNCSLCPLEMRTDRYVICWRCSGG